MKLRKSLVRGTLVLSALLALVSGGVVHGEESSDGLGSKTAELKHEGQQQACQAMPLLGAPAVFSCIQGTLSGGALVALQGAGPLTPLHPAALSEVSTPSLFRQFIYTNPTLPQGAPVTQAAPAGIPFRDPAPAFSRNLLITRDFGVPFQTEPSIAVNPNDSDHLVMSTIDYNFPSNSTYVSIDGGETWQGPFQNKYVRGDLGAGGDPVVAFERNGDVHSIGISIGFEEFSIGPLVAFVNVSSIFITSSEDGGYAWGDPIDTARSGLVSETRLDEEGRVRGTVTISFLDKPWLAIGPDPEDADNDILYITYTDFEQTFNIFYFGEQPFLGLPTLETTIKMVRSTDGGRTWTDPQKVSETVTLNYGAFGSESGEAASAQRRIVQGSQPAVAPDGTVYVTWMDTTDDDSQRGLAEIYVARSENGGSSFSRPVRVSTIKELNFRPRAANFRYWGAVFPQIATGSEGEVYVAYTALPPDKPRDDGDIYVARSLDRGVTWQRPVRINGDDTDRVQFFPSIATSPNGTVHVMWGDMRDDPQESTYHIYYTRSEDQGETWGFDLEELDLHTPDTRVTDFPSNPNEAFPGGQFIGDYMSIAATDEDVYMVWPDARLGSVTGQNQKIGFARQRAITSPEVFLNPPSGPGGQPVTVQGFNFQPDTDYFIQVGGVTVHAERTNEQGQFTSNLFIPISGEGAHNVRVFDLSGNLATGSFFMEFGFDNVKKVQDQILKTLEGMQREQASTSGASNGTASASGTPAGNDAAANAPGGCSLPLSNGNAPFEAVYLLGFVALGAFLWRRR